MPPTESAHEAPAIHGPPREPDLVDAIFAFLLREHPHVREIGSIDELKRAVREQFGGDKAYVRTEAVSERMQRQVEQVLKLFDGRNASEVARCLGIGRATVYRVLKQARRERVSRIPVT